MTTHSKQLPLNVHHTTLGELKAYFPLLSLWRYFLLLSNLLLQVFKNIFCRRLCNCFLFREGHRNKLPLFALEVSVHLLEAHYSQCHEKVTPAAQSSDFYRQFPSMTHRILKTPLLPCCLNEFFHPAHFSLLLRCCNLAMLFFFFLIHMSISEMPACGADVTAYEGGMSLCSRAYFPCELFVVDVFHVPTLGSVFNSAFICGA